ncbi:hypothetical protein CERSUDRAFT_117988 [Gelatoporia subvermispora B]|uniref:SPX domain-containing protein n=1 Tax=Ceriporiopsis subvermispora (strain B) TaxID=914234 RepID=M2QMJ0_CERS8|nr:hypothetical protein CERSUDRAFT_117988 [Gelatoporia subvermispora B]
MKFSSSLKFNAVPEWWDDYIAYDTLKKYIYQLEKQQAGLRDSYHDLEANERSSLMANEDSSSTDTLFIPLLDRELRKICAFYEDKEKELLKDLASLERLVEQQEEAGPDARYEYLDHMEDDDDDEEEDDDFPEQSPLVSRDQTQSPSTRRRRLRSVSSSGQHPSGSRGKYDTVPRRRYSISSNEDHADLEASIASLRASTHQDRATGGLEAGRGDTGNSPMTKAKQLASKLHIVKDNIASSSNGSPETVWTARNNYAWDVQLLFKRRITNLYVSTAALKSYVELNYSGFRKILKKYDKVTDSQLQARYLHEVVEQATPFRQESRDRIQHAISSLVGLYTRCVTRGDAAAAQRQLKVHVREHIAWERDTVWRQMIGQARRGEAAEGLTVGGGSLVIEPEKAAVDVRTRFGQIRVTLGQVYALVAVVVFVVLLNVQVVQGAEANRCFAILVLATILWATEAIPLFITSILVPSLLVGLRVIRADNGDRLSTVDATHYVFSVMFSPTIMLLIGGFTIAAALSKTSIDRVLITKVLSFAGTRPSTVLVTFMAVACFASMWISNVAAPTLCFTLIQPILRTLPPKSSFAPCLILGIALAANIGGQSSPISSPQNLIAIDGMSEPLDWARWFAVSLPVSFIEILLIWALLLVSYRPTHTADGEELEIKPIRASREPFSFTQWWVSLVCLLTIALWCVEHAIQDVVGDMGVIAILPIVVFYATGVLKKDDFEHYLWTVVFLAMGGIALGKGVTSSGLLVVLGDGIREIIAPLSPYSVVLVLSLIVLVVSTFISHTIASVLLVPIAKEVGASLPGNQSDLLVFLTGLVCSCGMGMPVSGFPNQTAANQEDDMGQLYLSNVDFLKNGVPASIIATMVVATLGYLLMKLIGL